MPSVLGGLMGVAIEVAAALLLPVVPGLAAVIPWNAVVLAFGFSGTDRHLPNLGFYPARRGAQFE